RLWSLDKAQNVEDLKAWLARAQKLINDYNSRNQDAPLPEPSFVVELKFDGLSRTSICPVYGASTRRKTWRTLRLGSPARKS
ncbi:hypothetical protein, partial [Gordoniibacillus kamchatkensis]|uniref:hypothetical protein n=1 Tax=Gordoniibacillus kamchatkensis TaxID=1590651 RepID=UPI001E2E453B